ncbi:transposase [Streptomyces sp. HC307]|uniref:transposase n=1 Tax=Streptomyces flavusporus TaxID=3385496 RepID=UPI0039173964
MGPDQQQKVLELLDVCVIVTGPVPRARKSDCSLTKWFRERNRPVPVLTEAGWAKVEPVLMAARQRQRQDLLPDRDVLEAILHKARTGAPWPTTGCQARYHRWVASGVWEKVMEILADAEGTRVPPAGALPPLRIEGWIDPRLLMGIGSSTHDTVPTSKGISAREA